MDQETQQILASTELGFRFGGFSYGELARASAAFQTDGSEGRHDEEWLAAAWVAHRERAAGRFEEMEEAKFKEQWGTESGEEYEDSEDEAFLEEKDDGKEEVKESVEVVEEKVMEKAEKFEDAVVVKEVIAEDVVDKEALSKEVIAEEVVANGKAKTEIEEAPVPEAFVEEFEKPKEVEKAEEIAEQIPIEEAREINES